MTKNFEPCAAEVMRRFATAAGGEWIEVGGGIAGYCGEECPVNAAKGMDGDVTREDLENVIAFYGRFEKDALVELAPWVMERCKADLEALGFLRVAAEDVMARRSEGFADHLDAVSDEAEWSRLLSLAFFGEETEMGRSLGGLMFRGDLGQCAGVYLDGVLAAGGQWVELAGMCLLAGDGTLERFRGRGLQQRVIRGRVRKAWESGLEWVHSEVSQGSISQRNYQRCGFEKAYDRTHFLRPFR